MPTDRRTFTLRPGGLSDTPAVTELANACSREISNDDELSLAEVEQEWRSPAMNLATNTRVAIEPGGELVGCIEVWSFPPYVGHWLWGRVLPSWRGHGVGTALMEWAEARVAEEIDRAPAGTQVSAATAALSNDQPTIELMRERGYAPHSYSLTMERALADLPPAPAPAAGLALRAMRPGEEQLVYRVVDESFQDHRGHVATEEAASFPSWLHHMTERPGFNPALWLLATEGDEIAGVVLCYPTHAGDDTMGWVGTLGVRRPWRKRGVGRTLLLRAFELLAARGCTRVGLGVDAQSLTGATHLYEAVGMHTAREHIGFRKVLRAGVDLHTEALTDA